MTDEETNNQERKMIEAALNAHMFVPQEWRDGDDGLEATLGRYRAVADDEEEGLFAGDEGVLVACVVGSAEYHNQRVSFSLEIEGRTGATEIDDILDIVPI